MPMKKSNLYLVVMDGIDSFIEPARDGLGREFRFAKKELLEHLRAERDLYARKASEVYHLTEAQVVESYARIERERDEERVEGGRGPTT